MTGDVMSFCVCPATFDGLLAKTAAVVDVPIFVFGLLLFFRVVPVVVWPRIVAIPAAAASRGKGITAWGTSLHKHGRHFVGLGGAGWCFSLKKWDVVERVRKKKSRKEKGAKLNGGEKRGTRRREKGCKVLGKKKAKLKVNKQWRGSAKYLRAA